MRGTQVPPGTPWLTFRNESLIWFHDSNLLFWCQLTIKVTPVMFQSERSLKYWSLMHHTLGSCFVETRIIVAPADLTPRPLLAEYFLPAYQQ